MAREAELGAMDGDEVFVRGWCEAPLRAASNRLQRLLGMAELRPCFLCVSSRLPVVHCAAGGGDVVLMDSRLLHCGGSNTAARRRRLVYFTLQVRKIELILTCCQHDRSQAVASLSALCHILCRCQGIYRRARHTRC